MKHVILLMLLLCGYVLQAQEIFSDTFEDPGFKQEWTATPGTNGLIELTDVTNAASEGKQAVRLGKTEDGDFVTNTLDLTLNLADYTQVELNFDIRDNDEETHEQDGLYFNDGSGFVKVYDFRPDEWCNEYGSFPPFDVDALAAAHGLSLTGSFIIRFQQHDNADFSPVGGDLDGFYIDNVVVRVPPTRYVTLPFTDTFEAASLDSAWSWSHADSTALPNTTSPSGLVQVTDNTGNIQGQALQMGKICDGGFVTNAVDLHLDLAGQSQVELSFDIRDSNEETHAEDGIYFSDDAGTTFTKVYNFRSDEWCDEYGSFPPFDVDALAAAHGLSLTGSFIIRFQQHDNADFSPVGGDLDGFYIDNVVVRVPPTVYATLPFEESFESGALGDAWSWSYADSTALPNTTSPSGFVQVNATAANNQGQGLQIGKICDGGFVTNAVDLHLDLAGQSQVELSFDIRNFNNELHEQDGLYLSSDGGNSFTKIYAFDFAQLPNQFSTLSFNIVPSQLGISFSDSSVIRFQQYDDADFSPVGGDSDGLYIDNVVVRNTLLPFITSFSPGIAPVGREITIIGINFSDVTSVEFDGTPADSIHIIDSTTLIAIVPEEATNGKIRVTNAEGFADSESPFIVSSDLVGTPTQLSVDSFPCFNQLVWADTANNETGFIIERKTPDIDVYNKIATLGTNDTSFADNDIENGVVYEYRVLAFNALGNSAYSEVASTTSIVSEGCVGTDKGTVPAAPSGLSASSGSDSETRIDLSWQDNSEDEAGFIIFRRKGEEEYEEVAYLPAGTTSYTDIGLDFNTTYTYKVLAYNSAGNSGESDESSATTVDKILGIDEMEKNGISIYPNPAIDQVVLQLANEEYGSISLRIYNMLGQEKLHLTIEKKQSVLEKVIHLATLGKGMYLLEVRQGERSSKYRFVKQE